MYIQVRNRLLISTPPLSCFFNSKIFLFLLRLLKQKSSPILFLVSLGTLRGFLQAKYAKLINSSIINAQKNNRIL